MKLIVGLGNPGKKYKDTRHNAGYWTIDVFKRQLGSDVKAQKTTVFMNESGKEVKQLVEDLPIENLLVVHDDLDLKPGVWKLQFNHSAAGHKGVQSVIDALGTREFWRLRIGVGRPNKDTDVYVLEEPSKEDRELIEKAIEESAPRVLEWASTNL